MLPESIYAITAQDPLPFIVDLVTNDVDLQKATTIRAEAYGRKLPEMAAKLRFPDELDREPGVSVFLATSKVDGQPLGTLRVQSNLHRRLLIEQAVELPAALKAQHIAELTRLAVTHEKVGRLVKLALLKASYEYCLEHRIDALVIGARRPIDRQYRDLLFTDVHPGMGPVPLAYANNIPHHILSLDIGTAYARFQEVNHRALSFMTLPHPDICARFQLKPDLAMAA